MTGKEALEKISKESNSNGLVNINVVAKVLDKMDNYYWCSWEPEEKGKYIIIFKNKEMNIADWNGFEFKHTEPFHSIICYTELKDILAWHKIKEYGIELDI